MIKKLEKMGVKGRFLKVAKKIYKFTENEIITDERVIKRFIKGKDVR